MQKVNFKLLPLSVLTLAFVAANSATAQDAPLRGWANSATKQTTVGCA